MEQVVRLLGLTVHLALELLVHVEVLASSRRGNLRDALELIEVDLVLLNNLVVNQIPNAV
jgi:hypothetical protein